MQFITTDQRIAVENFKTGLIYTVTFTSGRYFSGACIGIGKDYVMFQRTAPELVYCLNMAAAEDVESIEQTGGGGGTLNYNDLYNKPQINNVELTGDKSSSDLGLAALSDIAPLQAELVELVDSGAKNIINNNAVSHTVNGVAFTVNADGTITATGTATDNASIAIYIDNASIIGKNMIVSGCPEGGSNTSYRCFLQKNQSGSFTTIATLTGNYVEFIPDISTYRYLITVYAGYTVNDLVFDPMICSAAAWAISQTYKPYTPTLYELYQMIQG